VLESSILSISLPNVSYGNYVINIEVPIETAENNKKGVRRLISYNFEHIQGISIPPTFPTELAMPIPVVLTVVEYTSAMN